MGCPQRRALRGGAAEDRDATKHHDGAEESARAKVTCAQRLRRAERRAAQSFDGAADGGCADQEGTLKGVALRALRALARGRAVGAFMTLPGAHAVSHALVEVRRAHDSLYASEPHSLSHRVAHTGEGD